MAGDMVEDDGGNGITAVGDGARADFDDDAVVVEW